MWRKASLQREAQTARNVATAYRRKQVSASDGTPEGDQEAAEWRELAEAEEGQAARASEAARRPAPLRLPVRRPGYLED